MRNFITVAKDPDLSNRLRRLVKESMVQGIPQILETKNPFRSIFRLIIFTVCFTVCIYQVKSILNLYWKYEVRTSVQVDYSAQKVLLPSFTFCNIAGFQVQRYCEIRINEDMWGNMQKCIFKGEYIKMVYERAPRFKKKKYAFHIPNYYIITNEVHDDQYSDRLGKYLQPLDMLLETCNEFGTNAKEYNGRRCNLNTSMPSRFKSPVPHINVCYTVNTLLKRPNAKPEMVYPDAYTEGLLYLDFKNYNPWFLDVSAHISFHSPFTAMNPYTSGFEILPGRYYIFKLHKVVKKSLPFPYSTDCVDYRKLWKERGNYGPTNEQECIQECWKNASLELVSCVPIWIHVYHHEDYCDFNQRTWSDVADHAESCSEKCKIPCFEEYYEVKIQEKDIKYLNICKKYEHLKNSSEHVFFKMEINGWETTTYAHQPRFQSFELYRYIGGCFTLCLGLSVLPLFDFMEATIILLFHIIKKIISLLKSLLPIGNPSFHN